MLAEPVVLAAAKEALYPEIENQPRRYAVVDTQFTTDSWGNWSIPSSVHSRLEPFNAIRLNSGEPDLIGVGSPPNGVLNARAASNPVVAVEAKGHNTSHEKADIARGIEQAHSHLPETNLGYVAAPMDSVTHTTRSLARELNIGILGVHANESVEFIEPARMAGAGELSTGIEAIRFQATTHQLTAGSFPVNHPKNFLGFALALAADGDTTEIYTKNVIRDVTSGRRGAMLLNLVDPRNDGEYLTHLGAEVVRFARQQSGSVRAALRRFDEWTGKRTRFTELAPQWAQLARSITVQYKPTQLVVDTLEQLHAEGSHDVTLPELVIRACELNRPLAVEVFVTSGQRENVLKPDGEIDEIHLDDPTVYKSGAYFQFKAQLYHLGLLTTGGTDNSQQALNDTWRLEHTVGL
jgi:hypothetical protein